MITVKDMFQYSKSNNIRLLSDFPESFWEEYIENYSKYDKLFSQLYSSFYFFHQEDEDSLQDVTSNFSDSIYNFLLVNRKRYSELYKIEVYSSSLSFDENYKITERYSENNSSNINSTYGSRTDSASISESLGEKTDSINTAEKIGSRTDSSSSTDNIGSKTDNTITTIGELKSTESTKHGGHTDMILSNVSPYDDEDYFNKERNKSEYGEQSNTTTNTVNEHSDTSETSFGSQKNINTSNITIGEQNNTTSVESVSGGQSNNTTSQNIKGSSTDTSEKILNSTHEKIISGFSGSGSPVDLIKKHKIFWNYYDFYIKIFEDICDTFLCI